jgi:large subunit ribosomal protein L17
MRHRKKVAKLGRVAPHRNALLRNLVTDLLRHERLTTTLTKAKALRPVAERMVTLGKRDTLHARRRAARLIRDEDVVRKVFNELAPRYAERPGGYTRIMRLEPRAGDRAEMAIIEMVEAGGGAKE